MSQSPKATRHIMRVRTVLAVYAALLLESAKVDFDPKGLLHGVYSLDAQKDGLQGIPPVSWEGLDSEYRAVAIKALLNQDEISERISEFLDGWSFDRLPLVTRAILLVSYSETVLVGVTPRPVSINEALVILKQFGSPTETRYVNAVLERTLSKALGEESDYKGPGKVHVSSEDIEPEAEILKEIQEGEITLKAPSKEE